jgi:molybdopterin converting factor small subunit
MNITVSYGGQLAHAIGRKREKVECKGPIELPALLADLAVRHGDAIRPFLFDEGGSIRKSLLVALNDSSVNLSLPPTLNEGDEVTLLPPISGG